MRKNLSKKWILLPIAAVITFGLTKLAFRFPGITEKWFSQNLYVVIARIISPVSNIIPFSLDDIFYVLLILALFCLIILLIFRKITFAKTGKIVLNVLAATYILFYFLWGFNYFREDLYQRLKLTKHDPSTKAFVTQLKKLVENTNKSWCTFENWDKKQVDQNIEKSFKTLAPALKIKYPAGKGRQSKLQSAGFLHRPEFQVITGHFLMKFT